MKGSFSTTSCFFILLCLLGTGFAQPSSPGFVIVVGQSGLDYFEQVALPLIESELQGIDIPDITGYVGTPIGNVQYSLTGISITSVSLSYLDVTIESYGINVAIGDLTANVDMDWSYEESDWPHISDSGSADVSTSGTSAEVGVELYNSNGSPQLSVQSVSISIGSLNINLYGGASWLYQIFVDAFSPEIQSAIQSALQGAMASAITSLANPALATLPLEEAISSNPPISIDYELIGNPTYGADSFVALPGLGEFQNTYNPTNAPYEPSPINVVPGPQMVEIYLTDYVFNSAGYVAFGEQQLQIQITPGMVPSGLPVSLNTTKFCLISPGLCKMYPEAAMVLNCAASEAPFITISSAGGAMTANGTIEVYAMNETSGQNQLAFTLGIESYLSGSATMVNQNLLPSLTYINASITLLSSEVGYVSVFLLQTAVDILFSDGLVPIVNKAIGNGFTLPVLEGITFQNPSVGYNPGYLSVSTDISYAY